LLALALISVPVVAKEEELIADKAKTAMGFSMLSNEGVGISLWRVHSRAMIGFGIDVLWMNSRYTYEDSRENFNSMGVITAFTVKQIHSGQEVASFSYQTLSGGISRNSGTQEVDRLQWSAKGEIGIGFIWRPPKKVNISLRQGLALGYSHNNPSGPKVRESGTISFRTPSVRLLVLCYF
jgi:hypothetical protein